MNPKENKILIIDDDEMILKSLSTVFLNEGFEVLTAKDGNEGLVQALNKEPNLIITDVEMDKADGMSVLHEIRKAGAWGDKVPVVILTNFDASDEVMKGIVADRPSLFLLKSKVNPVEILERVKDLLSKEI